MITFNPVLPEEVGLSSERILRFIERLEKKQVPMHSFQFLCQDKLIAEAYYQPYQKDTLHRMFSISKSITSLAIGFLEQDGKLSLADKIIDYFPDMLPSDPHPWLCAMTIKDMLMMRTCHASTTYKIDMTKNWVQSFFITPPSHPAGQIFHYDTSAAHVLCALVERLSGKPIWDYFREKVSVLGLSKDSYFLKDPFGVSLGGSGLVCLPSDLLKIAYFMEQKGIIDGKVILNPAYIETATSCLTATCVTAPLPSEACGYGYQIWQNQKGGYTFYGMGGQLMIFLPRQNFICITTADTQGMAGGNQLIYDALYEEILPYLGKDFPAQASRKNHAINEENSEDGLSKSDAGQSLRDKLKTLRLAPLPTGEKKPNLDGTSHHYRLAENPQKFTRLELSFESDENGQSQGKMILFQDNFKWELPFGFGFMATGIFPKYEQKYAASGTWLDAETLYVKFHVIDAYEGSVHVQIHFDADRITLFLKKQEESLFQEFRGHLTGEKTE